jgi:hypothetical protein
LFQGTGNVLQQSSSLFWDGTNNRLGIGTSSPAQTLDVNGNTQITGNLIFPAGERLIQYGASSFFAGRDAAGVYLAYGFGSQQIDIGSASTGNIRLRTTANVILDQATSKLLIGTTTDAGFRLDVNGTARVVGNTLLDAGIIATSTATTRLQGSLNYFTHNRIASSGVFGFQISSYGTLASFWRWDGGTNDTEFGGTSNFSGGLKFFTAGTEKTRITAGGNLLINTTTDAGFRLDVNGTVRSTSTITGNNLTSVANVLVGAILYGTNFSIATNGQTSFGAGGFNAPASALVAVTSTTQGFLPPRMTTTQKNAIASPAAGLMVYDTTLNVISYYNGTSWI